MRLIVTGLECSGTKWMTELLNQHPGVSHCTHTSIPEFACGSTRLPELLSADAVVWMVRYEPFRLQSLAIHGFDVGRPVKYTGESLYLLAISLYKIKSNPKMVFVSYEGLIGPLGQIVFKNALTQLGLCPFCYPMDKFMPRDENAKYIPQPAKPTQSL